VTEQHRDRSVHDDESSAEQLDRNMIELLNELRVSGTGIQVLFAFLLIVPFNTGYKRMSRFDKIDYFVALLSIASAAMMLIAPSVHHRLLFRHHQRAFIVRTANQAAIAGMGLLALGLVSILVLISNLVFGTVAAIVVGVIAGALLGGIWFLVPLRRRLHAPSP
jgi:hypothetical protein